jgi:hypothetical protein
LALQAVIFCAVRKFGFLAMGPVQVKNWSLTKFGLTTLIAKVSIKNETLSLVS